MRAQGPFGSPAGVSLFSIPGVSASYPCDRTRSSEPACPTMRLVPDGTSDVSSINLRLMVANLPFDYASILNVLWGEQSWRWT
jgi:hypothetical protein